MAVKNRTDWKSVAIPLNTWEDCKKIIYIDGSFTSPGQVIATAVREYKDKIIKAYLEEQQILESSATPTPEELEKDIKSIK